MKTSMPENFYNKSELCRDVCRVDPSRTNKEIRIEVERRYGVKVAANLVVAACGTWKSRNDDAKNYSHIVKAFQKALETVGNNLDRGRLFLNQAAASL